jgi:hypothetical protein
MYHNGKPSILASTLPAGHVDVRADQPTMVVCCDCGQWVILKRGIALWHVIKGTTRNCDGGGQRFRLDLSAGELEVQRAGRVVGARDADRYRARRSFTKPQPATAPALTAIARRNAQAVEICASRDATARDAIARLELALI